jgi:tRNA-splicing ligase RtcB
MASQVKLRQVDEFRWEIPREGKMRTRGLIFASQKMLVKIQEDQSLQQVANVATLPGIVGASLAMPDIHWGYGFPIGGVAAFNLEEGVVSPGGVGYDINCGVRLLRTNLERPEVELRIEALVNALFSNIPSGLGSRRQDLKLTVPTLREVMRLGAGWAVKKGFGHKEDLAHIDGLRFRPEPGQGPVGDSRLRQPLRGSGLRPGNL